LSYNPYKAYGQGKKREDGTPEWGNAVMWHELRKSDGYRSDWD
jgi:hypothetical protein